MAVFAGQVRRISQHLILLSNPPTLWEGVMRDRGSEVGEGTLGVASVYWEGRVLGNRRQLN